MAGGGYVADTPGFGEVGLWGVAPADVGRCFLALAAEVKQCRFRRCTHVHEPDCGVRTALAEGRIAESRYRSYCKLRGEAVEAAKP
jgi:ribosome biogenesis GTPase